LVAFLILILLAGCDLFSEGDDANTEKTQTAISIQQTDVAEKIKDLSVEDQKATQDARAAIGGLDTGVKMGDEPTTPTTAPQQTEPPAIEETPTPTNPPTPSVDFETWMKSANILLYEDMVQNIIDTTRYVKGTLDDMGLDYKDDGNAKGWFETDINDGAPGGEPWDLVILAVESKSSTIHGDFFGLVLQALDAGSSVIVEVWYLDRAFSGSASSFLERCGVQFASNWRDVPPSGMVMFPLDSSHPLLSEPHKLTFTKVTSYWYDEDRENVYDLGDRVQLAPGSEAQILVSTNPNFETNGTLTLCADDRMILQTFSSHQFTYDSMTLVWQNYILHGLKKRYESIFQ
jgi:hypothetical protein